MKRSGLDKRAPAKPPHDAAKLQAPSENESRAAIRDSYPHAQTLVADYLVEPSPSRVEELRLVAFERCRAREMLVASRCRRVGGDARFSLLAACGRRPAVETLLLLKRDGTPVGAAVARRACTRITGVEVSLPERIPQDELSDQITLCAVARAQDSWRAG